MASAKVELKMAAPYLQPCLPPMRMETAVSALPNVNHEATWRSRRRSTRPGSMPQRRNCEPCLATHSATHIAWSCVRPRSSR
eukprot:2959883-Heterocapsa_arctica.AAC.1